MINKMILKAKNLVLNFLFPRKCLGCGAENPPEGALCGKCFKGIRRPSLPKKGDVFSAADYGDEVAKKAIWALKYRKVRSLAEPLAELIFRRVIKGPLLKASRGGTWIIVPVPLSKKRLRERGFNQSELIAEHLSDKINADGGKMSVRAAAGVLRKIKDTPSQVSIKDKEERLKNLAGSFGVKNPDLIKDKNIIVIDDVTTTGATLKEARAALKESGAKRVIAIAAAR